MQSLVENLNVENAKNTQIWISYWGWTLKAHRRIKVTKLSYKTFLLWWTGIKKYLLGMLKIVGSDTSLKLILEPAWFFFIYCNVIVGNPISFIDISQWPKFDIEPDVAKCWPVCSISREKNSCRASLVWIHLRNIESVGVWKCTIFHRNAAWWCADITHRVPGIQSLHCVVVHSSNLGFN